MKSNLAFFMPIIVGVLAVTVDVVMGGGVSSEVSGAAFGAVGANLYGIMTRNVRY